MNQKIEFKQIPSVSVSTEYNPNGKNIVTGYTLKMIWAYCPEIEKNEDGDLTFKDKVEDFQENEVKSRRIDLSSVKTIFFEKDCTVPRFKLNNLCQKYGIKVTRYREKADIILFSDTYSQNLITDIYDDFIPKKIYLRKRSKDPLFSIILPEIE